jgi:tetratricopeptide (TPR) repeat protein
VLRNWAGQPDDAIEHFEAALRLSPRGRIGWVVAGIGIAHFLQRRYDRAIPKLLLASNRIRSTLLHIATSRHATRILELTRFGGHLST